MVSDSRNEFESLSREVVLTRTAESGSAWGQVFSRNPQTGVKRVSGTVHLKEPGILEESPLPFLSLQRTFPQAVELITEKLADFEVQATDAVQCDFTLLDQTLTLSCCRLLERSPEAACKIAVNFVEEGVIDQECALLRVSAEHIRQMLLPTFLNTEVRKCVRKGYLVGEGKGAWGGVISGLVAFDLASTLSFHEAGHSVILLCDELTYVERELLPLISGVIVSGGPTDAAEQYERPVVVLPKLALAAGVALHGDYTFSPGDGVSIDADNGRVYLGVLEVQPGELTGDAVELLTWADAKRSMEIRANVGNAEESKHAMALGASGIGLCRIESLFQKPERLPLFQAVVREVCLLGLESSDNMECLAQEVEGDVRDLLLSVAGVANAPATLRLLDAPVSQMMRFWSEQATVPKDYFDGCLSAWLHELNPMQGLRFGRLSLVFPALLYLQVRAILRAWSKLKAEGTSVRLQIMMPGVTDAEEIRILRKIVRNVAEQQSVEVPQIGSMLELPRACLTADILAQEVDFLSFGTGDLTESTCGLSRYDSQLSFLPSYVAQGVFSSDPFRSIDLPGVGQLMHIAMEKVKSKRPSVEMGTCGAQAIDPKSFAFCCELGLSYVSVPLQHVPVARLVAAQAKIRRNTD